jgi:hypothetical protein
MLWKGRALRRIAYHTIIIIFKQKRIEEYFLQSEYALMHGDEHPQQRL